MAVKQNKFLGEYSSVELESLAEYLFPKSYVEEAEVEIEDLIQLIWEPKGRKLLDIPCGVARHSLLLAKAGFNVTGVDFCQELLQGIEERAKADGIPYETVKEDMRSFERSNYEAFPIRLWELAWPNFSETHYEFYGYFPTLFPVICSINTPSENAILDLSQDVLPSNNNAKNSTLLSGYSYFQTRTYSDIHHAVSHSYFLCDHSTEAYQDLCNANLSDALNSTALSQYSSTHSHYHSLFDWAFHTLPTSFLNRALPDLLKGTYLLLVTSIHGCNYPAHPKYALDDHQLDDRAQSLTTIARDSHGFWQLATMA